MDAKILFSKNLDRQTRLVVVSCEAKADETLDLKKVKDLSFAEVLFVSVYPQEANLLEGQAADWDKTGVITFGTPAGRTARTVFAILK